MMHCPYQGVRAETGEAECNILTVACQSWCDYTQGVGPKICAQCIATQGWNVPGVESLKPESEARMPTVEAAMLIIENNPALLAVYKQCLRSRVIAGDNSRYQKTAPADIGKALTAFHARFGAADAEKTLVDALDFQLQKAKLQVAGIDDETTVKQKIALLAEQHGFITADEAQELRRM